jgi:poly(3-hydroxybutyrate) depolymerase
MMLFAAVMMAASPCELTPLGNPTIVRLAAMTCMIEKDKREAIVFSPADATTIKRPLVFAWHGDGATMHDAAASMRIHTLWPDAIVVYPDTRDLKFFDAMLETLRAKFAIDEQRIYTTGFSEGADFGDSLRAQRGKTFAAVAGVMLKSKPRVSSPCPKPASATCRVFFATATTYPSEEIVAFFKAHSRS